ncbi:hypothetical protein ACEQUB_p00001 (plasmid) [Ralstonia syzygii]
MATRSPEAVGVGGNPALQPHVRLGLLPLAQHAFALLLPQQFLGGILGWRGLRQGH